jgi:MarR family transcriptional regulator, transcriptional regulator for hemolysin
MADEQKLNEVIFFSIDQTNKKIKQYAQKQFVLHHIDITSEQWVLLKILEENNGISQVQLAEMSLKDTASITRMIDILEKKELIARTDDPNDRRRFTLSLTTKGQAYIKQHMPVVQAIREQGIKGFSQEELSTLKRLLEKVEKNMS